MSRVIWTNIGVVALLCTGVLGAQLLPPGPFVHGPGVAGQMFTWDADWYFDIAGRGYHWDPRVGAQWGHNQNVAFFPLFPLIERAIMVITGKVSLILLILLGLGFGLWSNFAFYRLARRLLPEKAANWAMAFFAFWPGICFLAMGYPTGLINLCAVSCLWHYVEGRRLQAVLWCGLGAAAAPTLVFIAAALCVDMALSWLRGAKHPLELIKIVLLGAISVWGLVCFMAYQQYAFGNPFAFIAAQGGYVAAPPFLFHLLRLFNPGWYLGAEIFAARVFWDALFHGGTITAAGRQMVNVAFQFTINFIAIVLLLRCLITASRTLGPIIIPLAGWFILTGYLWFLASSGIGLVNGIRMLYPAIAAFLILGGWAHRNAAFGYTVLALMALAAIMETALVGSGYGVI